VRQRAGASVGARVIGPEMAVELLRRFMGAKFSGADRHKRRVAKVAGFEVRFGKAD